MVRQRGGYARGLFSLSQPVIDKGLSIIVEGSASIFGEMREHYESIAKSNSIDFFEVNIEAPLETLQQRLRERVSEGKSLTVSEPEQLLKRYKLYLEKKDMTVPTYDTTFISAESIYTSICHDVFGR